MLNEVIMFAAHSLGVFFGVLTLNMEFCNLLGMAGMIPMLLMNPVYAGTVVPPFVAWISYFSIFHWSVNAYMVWAYDGVNMNIGAGTKEFQDVVAWTKNVACHGQGTFEEWRASDAGFASVAELPSLAGDEAAYNVEVQKFISANMPVGTAPFPDDSLPEAMRKAHGRSVLKVRKKYK